MTSKLFILMRVYICIFFALSTYILSAQRYQRNDEIAFTIGGSYYKGDLNYNSFFYSPHLAFGGYLRRNFSPHYSLRLAVTKLKISASDTDFSSSEYQILRDQSFDDNNIIDLALIGEYNFFPLTSKKHEDNLTPFLMGGFTFFYTESTDKLLNFAIPIGVGIKYKFLPKWTLQGELSYRLTFTDELDGVVKYFTDTNDRDLYKKQFSFDYTNDLYIVALISIAYQIREENLECPGYK